MGREGSREVTSFRIISTPASEASLSVTSPAKAALSTARAIPAGTLQRSATERTSDSRLRISSLSSPDGFSGESDLRLLLQTSSARRSVWWAGVVTPGLIS